MEIKQLEEGVRIVQKIEEYKSTKEGIKQTLKKLEFDSISTINIGFWCSYISEDRHPADEHITFKINEKFHDLSLKIIKDLYIKHLKFCDREIKRLKGELKKL